MRLNRHQRRAMKTNGRHSVWRPRLERLEDKLAPAVFMVTNTNDGGAGSLDLAIFQAENTPNTGGVPDEIHFNIQGAGVHTIRPSQSVPVIAEAVIIDGYTQPGASPNTLAVGDNAVLQIEIDCSVLSQNPFSQTPFFFGGDGSTVRGLCINHASDFALTIGPGFASHANNITIAGNFIGTDPTGMIFEAGLHNGIFLGQGVGETIGESVDSPTPADRNVIVAQSSPQTPMITFSFGTQDNTIRGNYIGINAAGTAALNGGFTTTGMNPTDGSNGGNRIENNVIVANNFAILLGSSNNVIRNNLIGTNAAGTTGLGGGVGIAATSQANNSANNTIEGNLISGGTAGILIGFSEPGTVIRGNKIGTDITGTAAIPNSGNGITIQGAFALAGTIGGTGPAEGNVIAFNGGRAYSMTGSAPTPSRATRSFPTAGRAST